MITYCSRQVISSFHQTGAISLTHEAQKMISTQIIGKADYENCTDSMKSSMTATIVSACQQQNSSLKSMASTHKYSIAYLACVKIFLSTALNHRGCCRSWPLTFVSRRAQQQRPSYFIWQKHWVIYFLLNHIANGIWKDLMAYLSLGFLVGLNHLEASCGNLGLSSRAFCCQGWLKWVVRVSNALEITPYLLF